ncbi:MAG: hypothetical protein ACFCUU_03250 [Cyclobacteriaceae bacterium]
MKKLILLFAAMVWGMVLQAQDQEAMQKIESARIALITERLGLSPEQAERFWPLYREFTQKRMELRRELHETRRGADVSKLSEEESKIRMENSMAIKQRELNLEKEYAGRMLNVINNQQMLSLKKAEDDFRRMLMERIERQRSQQMQREQMRERREEIIRQRRGN